MLESLLLYAAAVVASLGSLSLFGGLGRTERRRGVLALVAGLLLAAVALVLPAPLRRAARRRTRLDELVPLWQFSERHATRVRASPERVEAAVRAVTAGEVRLFRLLTALRNPRRLWRRQPASLLAPPAGRPLLETALASGFVLLAEEPGRELVLGLVLVAPPTTLRENLTPSRFRDLAEPGYAKAALAFQIDDEGGGWTALVTETRVFATDPGTARRFALYWRAIYPGSALLRRTWLRAIRRRAERGRSSPGRLGDRPAGQRSSTSSRRTCTPTRS